MSVTVATHEDETFIRFALRQRLEHIILLVAFTVLAVTGLIQKFNQAALAEGTIQFLGGIERVRFIHRTFALILAIEAIYHGVTMFYTFVLKRERPTMLPTPQDLKDAWQMILYFLGRRKERPLFDRYDFRQKFEYWAMVWGTIIMGLTGFMMWFPIQTTRILSGQWIVAAKAAHGAEAILAVVSILLWHMYGAHLNAEVFPLDTAIFTGKISKERMLREHPLEYARLMEERARAAGEPAPVETPKT